MNSDKKEVYINIGSRVKEARKLSGMTQEKLAEACDISWSAISRLENGFSAIGLETLINIADVLGVGVDFLLMDIVKWPIELDVYEKEMLMLFRLFNEKEREYALNSLKLLYKFL